ncbi:tubulin/FtsZ domain containing protein [Klebsormidium nitens]|uniref:Tubulin/FtsZ domain containing protein n=1 Tax=Klebsormidium nitens TaxID=105231 RepID=A0A1Y1I7D4_KLENI|nr:tubulin/FtsZ domain containing protein [Klebsormidium nitens]|eukprot:GAQ84627.1 tubulin/FtsZ domain containing protein [Klebsormidium nitens]
MTSLSAHLPKASAGVTALKNASSGSSFVKTDDVALLKALGPLRGHRWQQARPPPVAQAALAPQSMPNFSLHNVRLIGEACGETPKFRQIRMSSALQLPPAISTAICESVPGAGAGVPERWGVPGCAAPLAEQKAAVVKVVGVGYGGSKAIQAMLQQPGLEAAEFFLVAADSESTLDTDTLLREENQIIVGLDKLMGGQLKSQAELEDDLESRLEGADLVVVVAGMGGNTGSIPPVVAKVARRVGALTVGLVTKPFAFEGPRRASLAEKHVAMMKKRTDTLVVVPCDQLLEGKDSEFGVRDAFKLVDAQLRDAVKGLADMLIGSGLVSPNQVDVQSLLTDAGMAHLGVGCASGPERASEAAHAAVASPALQRSMETAQGVMYSITGDASLQLYEIAEISEIIHSHVGGFARANVLFAASADASMAGRVLVSVIAAGLPEPRIVPVNLKQQTGARSQGARLSKRSSSILWSSR